MRKEKRHPVVEEVRVSFVITHPDKVIGEEPPASAQLALPPAAIVSPYVLDDVAHRQGQLIVLLSLIVELHHGLHCAHRKSQVKKDQKTQIKPPRSTFSQNHRSLAHRYRCFIYYFNWK